MVAGPAHQFLARPHRRIRRRGGGARGLKSLIRGQWPLTVLFIFVAPMVGLISAYVLMVIVYWLFRRSSPSKMDKYFRRFQLVSAAAFSLSHGSNDAQKTAGLIAGVLYTSRFTRTFAVPFWVLMAAHAAIALGTLSGGWRIVHTMGGG